MRKHLEKSMPSQLRRDGEMGASRFRERDKYAFVEDSIQASFPTAPKCLHFQPISGSSSYIRKILQGASFLHPSFQGQTGTTGYINLFIRKAFSACEVTFVRAWLLEMMFMLLWWTAKRVDSGHRFDQVTLCKLEASMLENID